MGDGLALDIRAAGRALLATRATSLAASLTLALAIGAVTAIFSVADSLMLRPLPVRDPQRLVTITSPMALRYGFQAGIGWSDAMWQRLRERGDAFDGAFAWLPQRLDLSRTGESQPIDALFASGDVFSTLGVPAAIGRTFGRADDVRGGGPDGAVAVLSHDFWQRRFGGNAAVVGSQLSVEGRPVTVVGVARRGFRGIDVGQPFDVALPLGVEPLIRGERSLVGSPRTMLLTVMVRLKTQQRVTEAEAALRTLQPSIIGGDAPPFLKEPFVLVSASTGISDRSRLRQVYQRPIVTLAVVSGLVLLIVSVNLASLFLARAASRRQELSIRLAIGAPRWRLVRQLFAEGLVLGAISTSAAVPFAAWASRTIVAQLPSAGVPVVLNQTLDWRVLGFTSAVMMAAVLAFVAAPALYAVRVGSLEAMQESGRVAGGRRTGALSTAAIVAQVALSIVLLAAAGMFTRTLNRLANVPLGFDPGGMLVVTVNTPRSPGPQTAVLSLSERLADAFSAVPGVTHAAASIWTPVGSGGGGLLTDARGRRADLGRGTLAFNFVTPGWFATYGTAFRSGRDFDARDGANAAPVAIVNEALDRTMRDRESGNPVIHGGPCPRDGCTVIGVVADAVYGGSLRDAPPPTMYLPLAQSGAPLPPGVPLRVSVRTSGGIAELVASLATALRRVDAGLTFSVRPVEADISAALAQERLTAMLAGFFGASALLLSAVGLYGVTSYAVRRRLSEIGIRLALGAQPLRVVRTMLGRIAWSVLAGSIAGLAAASWLSRFVAPLLYGLEPRDPATLAAATVTLVAVAAIASLIPAWRAARVDPARLLRQN